MKRFLKNIALYIGIIIVITVVALMLGPFRITHSRKTWVIPQQKHILFCGASQINRGINDSLISTALNRAKPSERYMFTYLKLKQYLQYNPQIDTVFLQCAPTDLWQNADDKYFIKNEQIEYMSLYWTLFGVDEWKALRSAIPQILQIIAPRMRKSFAWQQEKYIASQGGYEPLSGCFDTIGNYPQHVNSTLYKGNKINISYLYKIIGLCEEYHIKLYLVFMPVWKHYEAYDVQKYYEVYKQNFGEIELLDYSNYNVDICERWDSHHLNNDGATKFTNYIKEKYNIQ